jgi:DNA-binding CsgD family transcriptional regulator
MHHPASLAADFQCRDNVSHGNDVPLNGSIETALSNYGDNILTARERDVVHLIIRGQPSKIIARQLKIAPKTEGVHRRNAYAKLGIDSRSALFRSFLFHLSQILGEGEHAGETIGDSRTLSA